MPGGQARMSCSPPPRRSKRPSHSRLTACPAARRPLAVAGRDAPSARAAPLASSAALPGDGAMGFTRPTPGGSPHGIPYVIVYALGVRTPGIAGRAYQCWSCPFGGGRLLAGLRRRRLRRQSQPCPPARPGRPARVLPRAAAMTADAAPAEHPPGWGAGRPGRAVLGLRRHPVPDRPRPGGGQAAAWHVEAARALAARHAAVALISAAPSPCRVPGRRSAEPGRRSTVCRGHICLHGSASKMDALADVGGGCSPQVLMRASGLASG